jgi:para-nitrobenzyl esterase
VSTNYRIGALGFLVPGDCDAPGAVPNAGLLDVALALRWVRENIERFGGDPGEVTIFGESAGGTQVTLLLSHPPARGFFRRAIAESAMDPTRVATAALASRSTQGLLRELGLGPRDVAELREVPLADIKAAQARVESEREGWPHFQPVLDDTSLPSPPAEAVMKPDAPRVPLIIGYNRDEWNLFDAANVVQWGLPLADEDAILSVRNRLGVRGENASGIFETYRESRRERGLPSDARAILRAINGDLRFRIGSQEMAARYSAREPNTYAYVFTRGSPALRGALGACHALELPFVFGTHDGPNQERFAGTGPAVAKLSRTMMHAWAHFARHGEPLLDGGRQWPAYDAASRRTMVFDDECRVEDDPFGEERRIFPP